MRIRVVQSGGLAALRRERVVETEQIPKRERDALHALVERAELFTLPEQQVSGLPDVIQYRVCVESKGHAHEIVFDDMTSTAALRDLVTRVLEA